MVRSEAPDISTPSPATHVSSSADPVDVVLLRWPEENARLERLRANGMPRLLLVGEELVPPTSVDPLEDWIRLPAAEDDLRARVATLAARAGTTLAAPSVDVDGLLRHRGRWVTLSPVERALAAALVERFGAVVGRDTLVRRAWPGGSPTRNALDVHMLRLRRRIGELGLEVRTVRARGYLLQAVEVSAAGVATAD
ncbi:MAG: winged helix-turn-helix domain-containing protein [Acidimicrobiia bacterium]